MRVPHRRPGPGLIVLIAALAALAILPRPAAAAEPVTTDYYLNHRSVDDAYARSGIDPTVLIHVREVVLPGNERRAPGEGKVLVLAHGAVTPGYVAFDLACQGCSMMRFFALAGWDVFTLDYEGYGLSTRQPTMDYPDAFPQAKAPTHTEVDVDDLARAIEFVRGLRGVDKVHLLGWSLGASRTAPIYTIQHPERVARLVLFAPGHRDLGAFESARGQADAMEARKVLLSRPSLATWQRFGATEQSLAPDALEAYRAALLASDPRSGELGGQVRQPAGRIVDLLRSNPQFDASRITVPTLVVRGVNDTFGTAADSRRLVEEIASPMKKFLEIAGGSHLLPYERVNQAFFQAVQAFLEAK
jgi:pimeloyl-ACP methyl ester carboxylesterase